MAAATTNDPEDESVAMMPKLGTRPIERTIVDRGVLPQSVERMTMRANLEVQTLCRPAVMLNSTLSPTSIAQDRRVLGCKHRVMVFSRMLN